MDKLLASQRINNSFGCKAMYQTTNNDYGQPFLQDNKTVPTYNELVEAQTEVTRAEKQLKNKTVATKFSDLKVEDEDEIMKEKRKFDRNVIVPKKFPLKEDSYKAPEPGLKIGNPLYMTANREYGMLKPTAFEIPNRFYPKDNTYSKSFPGMHKFDGLNTNITFSKVHRALDEY
ncbi:hypothetical protein TTHERM_01049330 (macronuclear) [Tetrahymena thermophila SB210]|uniref:Uncharacterized protein n=1 Tax=Tetrahymena thermophila (strain SB210) TaxID=312017 RepID=Q24BV4_TETTS|nr:hypothetical protein TTHERM_01049330 [Tetrahymena thermophila SB210]EAS05283.1 hypothetical protein TTHERM_01049330 [Tetrahymena thermophila SB210]8G2Z_1F Chain 1F, CFAP182A [Tetrahymena thermophila CU428]8G3D_1F Chain 1F, CFAP182A [Tetrahymena thermophila]|eukprot:XP_001025528.1 hypothetical protein TTHERM_01049330 [Tetrahymena thermophila SB210]